MKQRKHMKQNPKTTAAMRNVEDIVTYLFLKCTLKQRLGITTQKALSFTLTNNNTVSDANQSQTFSEDQSEFPPEIQMSSCPRPVSPGSKILLLYNHRLDSAPVLLLWETDFRGILF